MYAFECLESEPSSNNPAGILSRDTEIITTNSLFCRQSSEWTSPLKTDACRDP